MEYKSFEGLFQEEKSVVLTYILTIILLPSLGIFSATLIGAIQCGGINPVCNSGIAFVKNIIGVDSFWIIILISFLLSAGCVVGVSKLRRFLRAKLILKDDSVTLVTSKEILFIPLSKFRYAAISQCGGKSSTVGRPPYGAIFSAAPAGITLSTEPILTMSLYKPERTPLDAVENSTTPLAESSVPKLADRIDFLAMPGKETEQVSEIFKTIEEKYSQIELFRQLQK